jgi:SAM-dependent methyltransferase
MSLANPEPKVMPPVTGLQAHSTDSAEQRESRALAGESLYGNDFTASEIAAWFEDEREAYFDLYHRNLPQSEPAEAIYTYEALARIHGFDCLPHRQYSHALGIGSATGAELRPVLMRSERVTMLEPSDGFSTHHLDGKPVSYVKPLSSGIMPFADGTFDLIVGFSVLHHIPNVSTIIQELQRVLKPGGHVLLREPTHSMGDWRNPRRGLTRHERGIPVHLFRKMIGEAGLKVIKETRCVFSLIPRLEPVIRRPIWTLPMVVRLDAWLCSLPIWSDEYHASKLWHRFRPTGVAYVLSKPCAPTSQQS